MREIIALEQEIMEALPRIDAAAAMFDVGAPIHAAIRSAHDLLCNGWQGPGLRIDLLRSVAATMREVG